MLYVCSVHGCMHVSLSRTRLHLSLSFRACSLCQMLHDGQHSRHHSRAQDRRQVEADKGCGLHKVIACRTGAEDEVADCIERRRPRCWQSESGGHQAFHNKAIPCKKHNVLRLSSLFPSDFGGIGILSLLGQFSQCTPSLAF